MLTASMGLSEEIEFLKMFPVEGMKNAGKLGIT